MLQRNYSKAAAAASILLKLFKSRHEASKLPLGRAGDGGGKSRQTAAAAAANHKNTPGIPTQLILDIKASI